MCFKSHEIFKLLSYSIAPKLKWITIECSRLNVFLRLCKMLLALRLTLLVRSFIIHICIKFQLSAKNAQKWTFFAVLRNFFLISSNAFLLVFDFLTFNAQRNKFLAYVSILLATLNNINFLRFKMNFKSFFALLLIVSFYQKYSIK